MSPIRAENRDRYPDDPSNLKAMCQGCHLHYDRDHHAKTRAATRAAELEAATEPLFTLGGAS